MGTFTMELNEVLEITKDIGLNDYPIFNESYREGLNRKITRHFWTQEIGQETISMFQLAMSRLMDEIMPEYNQLYVLNLLEIDPLSTIKISTITGTTNESETTGNSTNKTDSAGTSTGTATSDSEAKSRAVASDYPQQSLQPGSDYATSSQDNISDSNASNTTDSSTTGESTGESTDKQNTVASGNVESSTSGYQGHSIQLLMAARSAVMNVDLLILERIKEAGIFMMIWDNTDSHTDRTYYNGFF